MWNESKSPDYVKAAKYALEQTDGEHPMNESQTWALLAIGHALVAIAEEMRETRKGGHEGALDD